MQLYYIGGSPCSGKSSVAQRLAERYSLRYFKVDDFLEKYIAMGASAGFPACSASARMSADEIWMRDPAIQCSEELNIYREIFRFVQDDLVSQNDQRDVITEGAAWLPELMVGVGVDSRHYVCITPTKDFQVEHYRQREWVPYILKDCSDKELAFANWMERDALFAVEVVAQCAELSYLSLVTDRNSDLESTVQMVCRHFSL